MGTPTELLVKSLSSGHLTLTNFRISGYRLATITKYEQHLQFLEKTIFCPLDTPIRMLVVIITTLLHDFENFPNLPLQMTTATVMKFE